jgi:hypothetical protein
MKKLIMIITVLVVLFNTTEKVYADSPLTSTYFSKAYYDIDIVEKASRRNNITAEMAQYLADENNPIDVKAALINALSWDVDGKNNAERYCQFTYGKSLKDIDAATLPGYQQFCIGYLLAMDDIHFETKQSLEYLRMAKNNMPDSLTVAILTFIVETMCEVSYDWPDRYNAILADTSLNSDMPEEAIQLITDYIILGIDKPLNIPKTGELSFGFVYGMAATVFLIAGYLLNKDSSLQITPRRI